MVDYLGDMKAEYKWAVNPAWESNETYPKYLFKFTFQESFTSVDDENHAKLNDDLEAGGVSDLSEGNATLWAIAMSQWANVAEIAFAPADNYANAQIALLTGVVADRDLKYIGYGSAVEGSGNYVLGAAIAEEKVPNSLYMHELGHVLGIDHPGHEVGTNAAYHQDATIMSYNYKTTTGNRVLTESEIEQADYSQIIGVIAPNRIVVTPMIYDIAVIQDIYGANRNDVSCSRYKFEQIDLFKPATVRTIWDAGGEDIFSAEERGDDVIIDLRGGVDANGDPYWSKSSNDYISIAFEKTEYSSTGVVNIERARGGSGNDIIYGGGISNPELRGNGGNDTIYGDGYKDVAGTMFYRSDTIYGDRKDGTNAGNDVLYGDDGRNGTEGGDDHIYGGGGNDYLYGEAGNDVLYGGEGDDDLSGGAGFDTYVIDTSETGVDRIDDDTGLLEINGIPLISITAEWDESDDNLWYWGSYTLQRSVGDVAFSGGSDLLLTFSGDTKLVLKGFTDGAYGITLGKGDAWVSGPQVMLEGGSDKYVELYQRDEDNEYVFVKYEYVSLLTVEEAYPDSQEYRTVNVLRTQSDGGVHYVVRPEDIVGSGANDRVMAPMASNGSITIRTYAGSDTIISHGDYFASQTVYAGDDPDMITIYGSMGSAYGEGGNDVFYLYGMANAAAQTHVYGGSGRDTFSGLGAALVDGGTGTDYWGLSLYTNAMNANFVTGVLRVSGIGSIAFSSIERLSTGQGNDTIIGSAAAEILSGEGGNDSIDGGDGHDTILGGSDNDTLHGGGGNDQISGDGGATYLYGDAGDDSIGDGRFIYGGSGSDVLYIYETSQAELYGGDDNDVIQATGDNNTLSGDAGNDSIWGSGSNNLMYGGGGNDTVTGAFFGGSIYGGDNDDEVMADGEGVIIYGGEGNDTIGGAGSAYLYGGAGNDELQGYFADTYLEGGAGDDLIIADIGNDMVYGGEGSDQINDNGGNDLIDGGAGTDSINFYGSFGHDTVTGGEAIYIDSAPHSGYAYYDASRQHYTYWNTNVIETEDGLLLQNGDNSVLLADWSEETTNYGIIISPTLYGTQGDDVLTGRGNDSWINGAAGDDTLYGGAGDDTIDGGEGNDLIDGGAGTDSINFYGSFGHDTVTGGEAIYVDGAPHSGYAYYDASRQHYTYGNTSIIETEDGLLLENGNNSVLLADWSEETTNYGITFSPSLYGTQGGDVLTGRGNDSWINGAAGDDTLYGGAGNDTLVGEQGNDLLYGGEGIDTFQFYGNFGHDTVSGGEVIILNGRSYQGAALIDPSTQLNSYFGYTLSQTQSGLLIQGAMDSILVSDWAPTNNYGLVLSDKSLIGTAGNDTLYGTMYDDRIDGGAGNDQIYGGTGTDRVYFEGDFGNDTLWGGEELYIDGALVTGNTVYDAETGTYALGDYSLQFILGQLTLSTQQGNHITLADWSQSGYGITLDVLPTATIHGTENNDMLMGGSFNEHIYAYGGDDYIVGGGGDDTIYGGTGNDIIIGSAGNDVLYLNGNDGVLGDVGSDTYVIEVSPNGAISIFGFEVANSEERIDLSAFQLPGFASLVFEEQNGSAVLLLPNEQSVVLQGVSPAALSAANFTGFASVAAVYGTEADDAMYGNVGNDRINGGDGNDSLTGGRGNDILTGGEGADRFIIDHADMNAADAANADTITDLFVGDDIVLLDNFCGEFMTGWNATDAGPNNSSDNFAAYETINSAESLYSVINLMTGLGGMRVLIDEAADRLILDFDDDLDSNGLALDVEQDLAEGRSLTLNGGWAEHVLELLGGTEGEKVESHNGGAQVQVVGVITDSEGFAYDLSGKTYVSQLF